MNLYEEIEKIKEQGFSEADAQSKLGQDIVLKAISDSGQVGISVSLPCLTAFSTMG